MNYKKLLIFLSTQRFERYLGGTDKSKSKAIRLYKANLKLAQSFHPLLGALEVFIRNRLNSILTSHFSDQEWIINQKKGFMNDPILKFYDPQKKEFVPNHFLKKSIEKSERKFKKANISITSGKIIADQSFGFWTELFELQYYKLLKGKPIQIFKNLPPKTGRDEARERLKQIRNFRNRISHNEPICFKDSKIDFSLAEEVYQSIQEILMWMDPQLLKWIKDIDNVKKNIDHAKIHFLT